MSTTSDTLATLVDRHGGKRAQKLLTVMAAIELSKPLAKAARDRYQSYRNNTFTITVNGDDDVYEPLHAWVLERMPTTTRKAMILRTRRLSGSMTESSSPGERGPNRQVQMMYDGSREQAVTVGQHSVWVKVTHADMPNTNNDMIFELKRMFETIVFTAKSVEGRDAVIDMIASLAKNLDTDSTPNLFIPSRWSGSWESRGDLPSRSLDSVILKEGQLEKLTNDLQRFLDSEDHYGRLSQPWHRGYLFYGPPGTGKTSVARALANRFELPVYYLPVRDIAKDTNLLNLIAGIEPRSVLLIEDVDIYSAATSRTDDKTEASLAAMLNALDGIWTPHGLVTILTTNHREALDDALVRAGRISVAEGLSLMDEHQVEKLAAYLDYHPADLETFVGQSPADLLEAAAKVQIGSPL